jgi:hypothetical protein
MTRHFPRKMHRSHGTGNALGRIKKENRGEIRRPTTTPEKKRQVKTA